MRINRRISSFYALSIRNNFAICPTTKMSCSACSCHICLHTLSWHHQYNGLSLARWECYLLMLKKYRLSRGLHKLVPYSEWVANIKPNFQVTFAWLKKSGSEINQISLHFVILFASFQLMHLKLSYKLTLCPVLTLPSN